MKTNNLYYFQFDPSVYCNADISCMSLAEQGLFIQICCMYWNRGCCSIAIDMLQQKLDNNDLIENLISKKILKIDKNNNIFISFLKEQYSELNERYLKRSTAGRSGGLAKAEKYRSNATAMLQQCHSDPLALDKIRIDKKEKKEKKEIQEEKNFSSPNGEKIFLPEKNSEELIEEREKEKAADEKKKRENGDYFKGMARRKGIYFYYLKFDPEKAPVFYENNKDLIDYEKKYGEISEEITRKYF